MRNELAPLLWAATFAAGLACSTVVGEELKVVGSGFSLVLPSTDWQVVSQTTNKADLVVLGPKRFGANRPTISVIVGDPDGGGRWHTAEGFREGLLAALKLGGATIETEEYLLGAGKAQVKATLATMTEEDSDHLTVIALHGDKGYCVICSTPAGTMDEMRPEFERLLRSFRFLLMAKGEHLDFEQYGFTIRLPEDGWVRVKDAERQDPRLALALQKAGDPETAPTFSIMVGEVPAGMKGPSALDALGMDALRELGNAREVEIGEFEKGALGSHPSLSIKVKGKDAEGTIVLTVRNDRFYHVAWSVPVGELERHEPELRSILNSIKFVEPRSPAATDR